MPTDEARAELREKVAHDDAHYRAIKRKIMALIADTWDGERLIENAADAAIAAALEQAAKHFEAFADDLFTGKRVVYEIRALITPGKEEREG
jgi:hypothetical protein